MKMIVTGVAGFIGSNLAERLLQEGCQVVGIDSLAYGVFEQIPVGVEFHKLDICTKEIYPLFKGVDFVFHLAAKNCISDCQTDPVSTSYNNVTGTVNVFEASRLANVKKVIYAESSAVYEGSSLLPTPESEVSPQSFYAVSKLCGMKFAEAYKRYYGLNTTALRYFCVYGPKQDYRRTIPPVMSAFIIKLLNGEVPVIYGNGEKRRDFVYVDDVNDFHMLCIRDKRTDGCVFNVGSGKNYSINDIYETISGILKSDIKPLKTSDLPGEALETLADISLARSLGWSPRVDLAVGLEGSIQFIKNNVLSK